MYALKQTDSAKSSDNSKVQDGNRREKIGNLFYSKKIMLKMHKTIKSHYFGGATRECKVNDCC